MSEISNETGRHEVYVTSFPDRRQTLAVSRDAGMSPAWSRDGRRLFYRSVERYAREQPDDPDVGTMLDRARRWRDAYLRWGRDALGFAAYLFYRPGARIG